LTKRNIQETNALFDQNRKSKLANHKKRLPTLRCLCGADILVVPDLKAMNQAIKNHLAEHKKTRDGSDTMVAFGLLEKYLTEQVLMVASKTKPIKANHRAMDDAP
jgi:hypothetical protein